MPKVQSVTYTPGFVQQPGNPTPQPTAILSSLDVLFIPTMFSFGIAIVVDDIKENFGFRFQFVGTEGEVIINTPQTDIPPPKDSVMVFALSFSNVPLRYEGEHKARITLNTDTTEHPITVYHRPNGGSYKPTVRPV